VELGREGDLADSSYNDATTTSATALATTDAAKARHPVPARTTAAITRAAAAV
jgi:hypothetical protein